METQTLKSKWWYRLLKILYIFAFIITFLAIISITYTRYHYLNDKNYLGEYIGNWTDWSSFFYYSIIRTIAVIFVSKIAKSLFFYVITGKWNFIDLKNKKEIINPFAGN